MPHSVLIVEDDPQFCIDFVNAINSDPELEVVGFANDLPEGLCVLGQTKPEVLLVDIGLPSGSGIELIHKARKTIPHCEVAVVTVFEDDQLILDCIEAGATGYILKGKKDLVITSQIHVMLGGGSPISPAIARRLLAHLCTPKPSGNRPHLSEQELGVLLMSAKGYSNKEIARLLDLSVHTVETYIKRIYRKLQVHNKTEAIFEARKLGLLVD